MGRYSKPVHEHDLILVGEKGEGDGEFKCGGCNEKEIPGGGEVYYWCTLCSSHFHETCAKLPLRDKSFFHPCPLFLHLAPDFICNSCFEDRSNVFTYHCERCFFDMCVECAAQALSLATTYSGEQQILLHSCHRHPLQPLPPLEPPKSSFLSCQVCNMPCSLGGGGGGGPTWGCEPCNFHLHKSCLDLLPQTIQIQKKPRSKLTSWVLKITRFFESCINCNQRPHSNLVFRRAGWGEPEYLCVSCCLVRRFIDESSSSSSQVSKIINHFFHPCPDLELIFSPCSTCNACFQSNHHQFFYQCNSCGFFLCFACAQLRQLLGHENGADQLVQHFCHWHPLKLFADTKEETNHICSLCERLCSETFYTCNNQCQFYIHKSCMDYLSQEINHRLLSQTLVLLTIQSFECTTCNRQLSGLTFYCTELNYKFCVKCVLWPENVHGNDGRFTSARHWHQLSFCETTKEHKASCFLCKQCCIGQSYKCIECAFFFHKSCAELPTQVDHPMHRQHSLTLTNRSIEYPDVAMTCRLCLQNLSRNSPLFDWVYRCHQCHFELDIQCSSCLPSLEYTGHPHLLYVVVNMHGERDCRTCSNSCNGHFAFHCANQECNFSLHLHCGPLPRTIKHARHVHPLILKDYYVEDNASDEFVCHVCEKHRNPRLPVYCCSQGCFMLCGVKCASSEVLPLLRGEHGEVELITPFPRVACRVINGKMMLVSSYERDRAEDGVQKTKYVFSSSELLYWVYDFGSEEEETFGLEILEEEDKRDEKLRSENEQEDEAREETDVQVHKAETSSISKESSTSRITLDEEVKSYSFSWKALSLFKNSLYAPSEYQLGWNLLRQYDGSIMTGTFALPETLGPIYEEFFGMYNIVIDKCKTGYAGKRALIFIMCCILHQMRITKVVDVKKDTILQWLGWIRYIEENGRFNVGFLAENIKQVWRAHYYIQSKKIVDDKSAQLRAEIEQETKTVEKRRRKLAEAEARLEELQRMENEHETYRVVGSKGPMKKERTDALEIKWRTCYETLVVLPGNAPAE